VDLNGNFSTSKGSIIIESFVFPKRCVFQKFFVVRAHEDDDDHSMNLADVKGTLASAFLGTSANVYGKRRSVSCLVYFDTSIACVRAQIC
jgi:hypothetical protein